ncbi:hypothetical protein [Zobellia alginiliquefaciens]|uniref:hypothetical protein n=1 Tax=Zobellia alginiliquefaciens TaxID=3032586 RepID=UPI0023E10F3E|nr:hypothetical protein [Zobellia alginiliquefaciens]
MKTKTTLSTLALLLFFQLAINAQKLNSKIEKSVVQFSTTFDEIPKDRQLLLDRTASTILQTADNAGKTDVVFIDKNNQQSSQLATVWLQTGMVYYKQQDLLSIHSAGTAPEIKPISALASLDNYGFKVRNARGENPISYNVKYGSDSWLIYPKSLDALQQSIDSKVKVILEKNITEGHDENSIELIVSEPNDIAREMLYLAKQLNKLKTANGVTK